MSEVPTPESARNACRLALKEDRELRPLLDAAQSGSLPIGRALALVPRVEEFARALPQLCELREQLARQGLPVGDGMFERFLVVATALRSVDRVAQLPVDARVRQLFYKKFSSYAAGSPQSVQVGDASFVAMCRIASLTRFPAGQLDWVMSGVPRSRLLSVARARLPKLLKVIGLELGGFAPMFVSHLDPHRPNQGMLLERESLRSYHRMARSMTRQPSIRGFMTASWFHSPDTFAVSPHLRWVNEVFLQNGGHVFPLGPADPTCGVLHRSPERQRAYDNGTFIPTEALVIWPRSAMLGWAEQRPDLIDAEAGEDREAPLAEARA
ncbi:MAG TPA: hypothetical protein VGI12_06485 [Vicinamibacterales bacterium]|jgi:hypothetical protein